MKPRTVGVLAAALMILTATNLAAQEGGQAPHSLQEGAWALQFGIGDNLSLRSFGGGMISAKHQRAEGRALRYTLSATAGHVRVREEDRNRTQVSLGLSMDFLRHPTLARDPSSDLHLFWGVGPQVSVQTQTIQRPDDDDLTSRSLSLGAGGTIGAAWFVRQRMSLSAEYRSTLAATFFPSSQDEHWQVVLSQAGVRFGVSVYF